MRNAAREGNLETLNLMLDAGADPNLCDHEGSYVPSIRSRDRLRQTPPPN
jgi:ankyrin repeat protein